MKILNLLKNACRNFLQRLKSKGKGSGKKDNKFQEPVEKMNYFNNSSNCSCGFRGGLWKL